MTAPGPRHATSQGHLSPCLLVWGAETLRMNGSRLKTSWGSSYWYVSTTDTTSVLWDQRDGDPGAQHSPGVPSVGLVTLWCHRRVAASPAPLPVDEEVHLLVVVPSQGATDLVVIWGCGHAAETQRQDGDIAGVALAWLVAAWPWSWHQPVLLCCPHGPPAVVVALSHQAALLFPPPGVAPWARLATGRTRGGSCHPFVAGTLRTVICSKVKLG